MSSLRSCRVTIRSGRTRLDVPVNVSDVNGYIQHRIQFHRPACNGMLQRLAFQILHRNEWLSVMFADFIDGADVGVVQR